MTKPSEDRRRVLTVHAPSLGVLGVVLEPWGEVYEVSPGTSVVVSCAGAARDELEITVEHRDGGAYLKFWAPAHGSLDAEIVDREGG